MVDSSVKVENAVEEGNDRRNPGRVLLVAAAVAMASIVGVRGVGKLVDTTGAPPSFLRAKEIWNELPALIARGDQVMLMFGSSISAQGFRPEVIDEELHARDIPLTTFNLAVSAQIIESQGDFIHSVVDEYKASGKRVAAIFIEVEPTFFQTPPRHVQAMMYAVLLGTPGEYLSLLWRDPEEGLRMFGRRYALGGLSGPYITHRLTQWFDSLSPWFLGQTNAQRLVALRPEDPVWTLENRGSTKWDERFESSYQLWLKDTRSLVMNNKAPESTFRDELVFTVLGSIEQARAIADKVFVVVPKRNPCAPPIQLGSQQHMEMLLERIERESGVPLVDLRDIELSCNEFEDEVHVERFVAAPKYSRALARLVADQFVGH